MKRATDRNKNRAGAGTSMVQTHPVSSRGAPVGRGHISGHAAGGKHRRSVFCLLYAVWESSMCLWREEHYF